MKSFPVEELRLDVLTHGRVQLGAGLVAEAFELDVFAEGQPLDLYPNQDTPHAGPANRLAIYWAGRELTPVYAAFHPATDAQLTQAEELSRLIEGGPLVYRQVGVKRGADFRTRFWPSVLRRIAKAQIAAASGKRIGGVGEAAIAAAASTLRDRARSRDAGALRALTLDQAVAQLTDAGPRTAARLPAGTVANIDCDFDSQTAAGPSENETGTRVFIGSTLPYRGQFRFPLAALPGGQTINDLDLQFRIDSVTGVDAGDEYEFNDYSSASKDDPDPDDAATKTSKTSGGAPYVSPSGLNSGGSYTIDLGATADANLQDNIDDEDIFSIGVQPGSGWESGEFIGIEAIEHAGSDPATLIVDYSTGGGGGPSPAPLVYHHRHHNRSM